MCCGPQSIGCRGHAVAAATAVGGVPSYRGPPGARFGEIVPPQTSGQGTRAVASQEQSVHRDAGTQDRVRRSRLLQGR